MSSVNKTSSEISSIASLYELGQVTAIDHIDFHFVLGDVSALLKEQNREAHEFIQCVNQLIHENNLPFSQLDEMIRTDKLGKLTSNPSILEKALSRPNDPVFTPLIHYLKNNKGLNAKEIWTELATLLIRVAAKKFEPVYQKTQGRFGIVSIETDPLAEDITEVHPEHLNTYLSQVEAFSKLSEAGNIDIKLASTSTGIAVLENAIARGIKINSTTLFPDACIIDASGTISAPQYLSVVDAYISGLEKLVAEYITRLGKKKTEEMSIEEKSALEKTLSRLISVDSQFVSRSGVLLHTKLLNDEQNLKFIETFKMPLEIAQLKVIYEMQRTIFDPDYASHLKFPMSVMELSARFNKLEMLGARPKYLFFASTGVKESQFKFMQQIYGNDFEIAYIKELIAPDTLGTHPPATYHAFNQSMPPEKHTISDKLDLAVAALKWVYQFDARLPQKINTQLLNDGYDQFLKAYTRTLSFIEGL